MAPTAAWGFGEKLRVRGFSDTAAGLPTAALADEILLPGDGQVKALFCIGGNPMAAWPDQERTFEAMKALDLLVTFDIKLSAMYLSFVRKRAFALIVALMCLLVFAAMTIFHLLVGGSGCVPIVFLMRASSAALS